MQKLHGKAGLPAPKRLILLSEPSWPLSMENLGYENLSERYRLPTVPEIYPRTPTHNMQLKCSSVTRIVLKGLLSTQHVLLQVGGQFL